MGVASLHPGYSLPQDTNPRLLLAPWVCAPRPPPAPHLPPASSSSSAPGAESGPGTRPGASATPGTPKQLLGGHQALSGCVPTSRPLPSPKHPRPLAACPRRSRDRPGECKGERQQERARRDSNNYKQIRLSAVIKHYPQADRSAAETFFPSFPPDCKINYPAKLAEAELWKQLNKN